MADTIKIGNIELEKIYLGTSDDVKVYIGTVKLYPQEEPVTTKYLTAIIKSNGTIGFSGNSTIEYSLNSGQSWTTLNSSDNISVTNGDKVLFRGTVTPTTLKSIGRFRATANFDVEGNPLSLTYGDDFEDKSLSNRHFANLFNGCSTLQSAENLILSDTTLSSYCYNGMFANCTALTTAPSLPATSLGARCYEGMFYRCTSLTTAPSLISTTLASACYLNMFSNCTSLTTAPSLPATTLTFGCYRGMFNNCTSLTSTPQLQAESLEEYCYAEMFSGCTSLTTAPELLATTLGNYCYQGMFSNCTSLTTAPSKLPATTLANGCYSSMFKGCTSLTSAPRLQAITLANSCYSAMFQGCTNLTTAPDLLATTPSDYCYQQMFDGCAKLNYIKCMLTSTTTELSSQPCTYGWTNGVASSGTFVKNSAMTSWTTSINGIPSGWTVNEEEPSTLQWVSYTAGDTVPSNEIYGVKLGYVEDNFSIEFGNHTYDCSEDYIGFAFDWDSETGWIAVDCHSQQIDISEFFDTSEEAYIIPFSELGLGAMTIAYPSVGGEFEFDVQLLQYV